MDFESEYHWSGATYKIVRLLEEVPLGYLFHSRIYRSSIDISGFAFCDRIELYCIAEKGKRALLVDTGHPDLSGTDALDGVENKLHVPWKDIEVFLTHFHDDHDGNLLYCVKKGAKKLYSGPVYKDTDSLIDEFLTKSASSDLAGESTSHFIRLVASGKKAQTETEEVRSVLFGGEELSIAGYTFEVLLTPGHTSNHLCLLDNRKKILFAGDHICYAPPGCMQFKTNEHLIQQYVNSIKNLREQNLQAIYMAHHNPLLRSFEINRFLTMLIGRYESLVIRARKMFRDVGRMTVREAAVIAASHYPRGLEGFPRSTQIRRLALMFGTLEYLYDLGLMSRSIDDDGALAYSWVQ